MRRTADRVTLSLALCAVCSAAVLAAEAGAPRGSAPAASASVVSAPPSSVGTWLAHLKDALTQSALSADYQKGDLAQVAAVRGAKQDLDEADPQKPVWKGGFADQDAAQAKKERAALARGVSLILQGKIDEGRAQIQAFETQYPKSALLSDAQEVLRKTAAAPQAAAPASAKSPAPATPTVSSTPSGAGKKP